jgi:pimeloyl-ACP methyl ester carboxylesterase
MMKTSQSHIVQVRGVRYHVRTWGERAHPKLVLLHGWMDVSASFQFLVDALSHNWYVIAPDWRGFGLSEWASGGYWFPDYIADLDVLLRELATTEPVHLVGHSMGGNVAGLYAGTRPSRVATLALLEGFGLPRTQATAAPDRYDKWLGEIADPPGFKPYASFEEVEARLRQNNPRLTASRAQFLAPHWAKQLASGQVVLRSDPAHKMVNPVLYRVEEALACWQRITAPVLWVWGDGEWVRKWLRGNAADLEQRRAAFRNLTEHTIKDAGHMMHQDQPEELARVLEAFLLQESALKPN